MKIPVITEHKILPLLIVSFRSASLILKFALTVFIAKFLSFDILGIYGLLMATTVMAPSLLGLAIMHVYIRDAVTQSHEKIVKNLKFYARYISNLYFVLVVIALIYGVLADQALLALLIISIIFLEHINNDVYNLMLNLSKQLSSNILHFIRSGLWMLIFMVVAYNVPSLRTLEVLLIFWLSGSVISLLGFIYIVKGWPWKLKNEPIAFVPWLKKEFAFSRTMYANNVTISVGQYINHFLVLAFLGLELTGIYVFFMQISSAMSNLLMTGIGQIARPKLVKAFKENDDQYGSIYKKCMRHTIFLAIFMSVISIPVVYLVLSYVIEKPLALAWYPVFFPIIALFIFTMIRLVNDMVFYSNFRDDLILKQGLLSTILGLILGVVFIYTLNLWGAVISAIITTIVVILLQRKMFKGLKSTQSEKA